MARKLILTSRPKVQLRNQYDGPEQQRLGIAGNQSHSKRIQRPQGRCAAWMVTLSCPSLLLVALFTIPASLFQMREHENFYFFWREMDVDPFRWAALALAAVCTLLAALMPFLLRRKPDATLAR